MIKHNWSLLEHTAQCSALVLCCKVHNPILYSSKAVSTQKVLQYLLNALIQTPLEETVSAVGRTFPPTDIISPILVHFFPLIQSLGYYVAGWTMVGTLREVGMPEKYLWNTIKLQLKAAAAHKSLHTVFWGNIDPLSTLTTRFCSCIPVWKRNVENSHTASLVCGRAQALIDCSVMELCWGLTSELCALIVTFHS